MQGNIYRNRGDGDRR